MHHDTHYLTLYQNQHFEELVKETAHLSDLNTIRFHFMGLLGMGAYAYILKIMLAKFAMLKPAMPVFLKIHREIMKENRDLDDHIHLLDAYEHLPYINQETDELIADIQRLYRTKQNQKPFDFLTTFQHSLTTKNEDLLIDLIPQLQAIHLYQSREHIKKLLESDASQHIKGLLMLQLIDFKFDDVIAYKKGKNVLQFNPIDTVNPFFDGTVDAIKEQLQAMIKDPSVLAVAQSLLSTYVIHMIPYAIDVEYYFLIALQRLARSYLRLPEHGETYAESEEVIINKKRHHLETILKL